MKVLIATSICLRLHAKIVNAADEIMATTEWTPSEDQPGNLIQKKKRKRDSKTFHNRLISFSDPVDAKRCKIHHTIDHLTTHTTGH